MKEATREISINVAPRKKWSVLGRIMPAFKSMFGDVEAEEPTDEALEICFEQNLQNLQETTQRKANPKASPSGRYRGSSREHHSIRNELEINKKGTQQIEK